MTRHGCRLLLWLALWIVAAPAAAQHGELQLGGVVSYGMSNSFHQGAGAVAGIALGRLVYVGVRWVYQTGDSYRDDATATSVSNRTQLFMMDLGLMLPIGGVEVVPGVSLGAMKFTQRDPVVENASEFVIAPGLSVHAHLRGVVVIPEIQYLAAGHPDLRWPADNRSIVAALRVVLPFEVRRIRY